MVEEILKVWNNLNERFPIIVTLGLVFIYYIFIRMIMKIVNKIYKKRLKKVEEIKDRVFFGFKIGDYELLSPSFQHKLILNLFRLTRFIIIGVVIALTLPIVFYLDPKTKEYTILATQKVSEPLKNVFMAIVNYIPNLITIAIIFVIIKYLLKAVDYLTEEIRTKKLVIKKFYPEWAKPTGAAIKIFLYVLALVIIAPYLPGSGSSAFKGISVMAGVLISMGSSSSVGNAISGLILTYMRSFNIGDKVKINDTEGFVVEKSLLVTRIRTLKNERVTIPNSSILSNPIVNHTYSANNYNLVIYTSVTIGYDVDWRLVHKLLIDAAKSVGDVLDNPSPFVLQVALNDFYVEYQLNCYINSAQTIPKIKSEIHQNIQDRFNDKGVEILSPHYRMMRKDFDFYKMEEKKVEED